MEAKLVLGILVPAMTFICVAGFLFLWSLYKKPKYGLILAGVFLLEGLGAGLNVLMEPYWPSLGLFVCGMFYMLTIAGLGWALLSRYRLAPPVAMTFSILLVTNVANGFALAYVPDLTISFGIITLAAGSLCLLIAYRLWNIEQMSPFDRALPSALLAAGVFLFLEPLFGIGMNKEGLPIEGYADSSRWIVMQMMIILLTVMLAASLSMMMIADILQDVQAKADIDTLTGISRRGPFEERTKKLLKKFDDTPLSFTMVVCDIDNFKSINDTYGHLVGDEVIKNVAGVLRDSVRETDIVARLGGEEFGILLWNCNATSARMMAEQLRHNIAQMPTPAELGDRNCTASFGVAQHENGETYKSMFSRADDALYNAKDAGRNAVALAEQARWAA